MTAEELKSLTPVQLQELIQRLETYLEKVKKVSREKAYDLNPKKL